jgi:hypothetical protein
MDPTNCFLRSDSFRYVLFQLLIQGSNHVSLMESELWFEIVAQLAHTGKATTFTSTVYGLYGDIGTCCIESVDVRRARRSLISSVIVIE